MRESGSGRVHRRNRLRGRGDRRRLAPGTSM